MKSFIEVIKEADDVQARLKFIQDPNSSTKSIVGLTRNPNSVIKNAAEEELKRRRDSGDQEAGASVQPPKDPSMHSATTQVGGDSAQTETKTKEVEPNNVAPSKKGERGREILNNLAKGKTITGDTPNAIELNPKYIIRADGIKEEKAPGKTVVFSFGRMNPPTIGHEKLVKAIEREAKSVGGTPRLYLSRTEGDDKNPLPYSKKNKFAKLAFPIVKDTPTNMMPAGFIGLLKHLEDQFDDVVIVVGSDRLANIKKLAERYNGTEYKYNTIKVVSAGERDPDEEGAAGMSASKMRQAVKDGNMAAFKAGLPSRLKGVAKTIFDELSKSLQEHFDYELDEAVLTVSQRLKRRASLRRFKGKIRMGQKRALARKASGKTIARRSKRIAIKMMRKRILRGRKYEKLSYSARAAIDRQVARRKGAISRIAKRVEPKLRQAESRRQSGHGYKSISLGAPAPKKKLKEEMSRDNLIQVVTEMFSQIAEEVRIPLTGLEMATLRRKCNESNNSFETLRTVFDRGVASWYTGLREDSTPQQWGFARVNSFIANGKTRFTADRDLLEQDLAKDAVEKQDEKQSLEIIKSSEDTYSLRSFKGHGSTDKVKAAAAARLKELGIDDDAKPVAQPAEKPAPAPVQQQTDQQAGVVPSAINPNRNPQNSVALADGKTKLTKSFSQSQQPPQDQPDSYETRARKGDINKIEKAVEAGTSNQDFDAEDLDREYSEDFVSVPENKKQKMKIEPNSEEARRNYTKIIANFKDVDLSPKEASELYSNITKRRTALEQRKAQLKSTESDKIEKQQIDEELNHLLPAVDMAIRDTGKYNNKIRKESLEDSDPDEVLNYKFNASSIKSLYKSVHDVLKQSLKLNAFPKGEKQPGDIGSYVNENASSVGAAENIGIEVDTPEGYMTCVRHTMKTLGDGSSGILSLLKKGGDSSFTVPEQNAFKKMCESVKPPIKLPKDKKHLFAIMHTVNMQHGKIRQLQKDLTGAGIDYKNADVIGFTGNKDQKQKAVSYLQELKEAGLDHVVNYEGKKVPIDIAIGHVRDFGGGENPGDTAFISRDKKTGKVNVTIFSDKQNLKAQYGNSTLNKTIDRFDSRIESLLLSGKYNPEEHKKATELVNATRNKFQEAQDNILKEDLSFADSILNKNTSDGKSNFDSWYKASQENNPKYLADFHSDSIKALNIYDNKDSDRIKVQKVLKAVTEAVKSGDKERIAKFSQIQEILYRSTLKEEWPDTQGHDKETQDRLNGHWNSIGTSVANLAGELNKINPEVKSGDMILADQFMTISGFDNYMPDSLTSEANPASHSMFHVQYGDVTGSAERVHELLGAKTRREAVYQLKHKSASVTSKTGATTGGVIKMLSSSKDGKNITDLVGERENEDNIDNLDESVASTYYRTAGDRATVRTSSVLAPHAQEKLSGGSGSVILNMHKKMGFSESFLSFGDFLLESADKAVGNVPVVSQKPIHHKASGHKYHIHHMINPDIALKHQVKHATQRFDRDVDSDIDQFDKPKSNFPDEVSVPTKGSTAKFFAKYKKEREHIHAGEPIDEQKIVFSEGPLSPIPKTAKPNLFHGNYGGKGNRGGEPVDKLDQAFQKHDTGYHYTPDPKKRLKHDKSLVKATSSIAKDKSQPIKTRVKAGMATALFKTKLALKKKDVKEQTITPKYTGDENSWYLDASGQKVFVYSQADLKHPEDVGEFLKKPTQQKDIGPMMSMKDFLKTQPEKKK